MENQDAKILWDFNIRANRVIKTGCPNIVLIDKKNQKTFIMMWLLSGDVIQIVIGALGAESLLTEYLLWP